MKVLVACEESQAVCKEFRKLGHEAYSCDIVKCTGGHPECHILDDAKSVLNGGEMRLQNGKKIDVSRWDLIIAHPPCTYLSNVATRSHSAKCTPINRIDGRTINRIQSMDFFMRCIMANCDKIAVENPIGIMNTCYRKPDQIIHPYYFADGKDDKENYWTKATCLWLKGLPELEYGEVEPYVHQLGKYSNGKNRTWEETISRDGSVRSKTFPGIAKAMAEQWGGTP